jgi:hypothetical protein
MPFTNPSFPGQIFATIEEFDEARKKRTEVEGALAARAGKIEEIARTGKIEEITRVTATIIPAPRELLERKVVMLERQMEELTQKVASLPAGEPSTHNKEGILIGTVLRGESRGKEYTLEVLEEGYLCSNGQIYDSLSGAAFGVSDNRRSGWVFWKDVAGVPIGETSGRFAKHASSNPFDSR